MPTMELHAFLQRQVDENPLLELDEPDPDVGDDAPTDKAGDAQEPPGPSLDEEWSSHGQAVQEWEPQDEDGAPEAGTDPRFVSTPSIYESLRLQLGCLRLLAAQRRLGELLIERLDASGYLEDSWETLPSELNVEPKALEAALRIVQRLDPPGVGARNLRECLMLQLERRLAVELDGTPPAQQSSDALAYRILRDHFEFFVQRRLGSMARVTGVPAKEVEAACERLRRLNPKPGRAFANDLPPSVVPDLVIRKREEHYDAELNDEHLPALRINRRYHRMLQASNTPAEVKEFLQERFRKASWVVKAIEERHATLLAIARCLISLQGEFIERGPQAFKPLTQAQVAGLVGRHASTVSRAIAGKTIDTPFGVFRLEQFFASGVPQTTERGEVSEVSDEAIKSEIQRLIAQEDTDHPLSDASLAERLAQRHLTVARRTITKYRTSLKILPAHFRKRRF